MSRFPETQRKTAAGPCSQDVDERRTLLVDDRADGAAGGIDSQQPQHLVPPLVVMVKGTHLREGT
jgi:hypothetical protein